MGLHVDLATVKKGRDHFDSVSELPEIRRRVWYSLYVLDRLLALQLGRPPAVSDEECYVSLPSVVDDMNHDWETEPLPTVSNGEKSVGEYFVRVIEFSSILGRVPRDLYHPRLTFAQKLENTRNLDEILLAWKQRLPRYLRFDVGHAFEKSMIFKRQVSTKSRGERPSVTKVFKEEHTGDQVSPSSSLNLSYLFGIST